MNAMSPPGANTVIIVDDAVALHGVNARRSGVSMAEKAGANWLLIRLLLKQMLSICNPPHPAGMALSVKIAPEPTWVSAQVIREHMRRLIGAAVLLFSVSGDVLADDSWKCVFSNGQMLYTNRVSSEKSRVLACDPVIVTRKKSRTSEDKFFCDIERTSGKVTSKRTELRDRDETGISTICTDTDEEKPKSIDVKTEDFSPQTPNRWSGWLEIRANEADTDYIDPSMIKRSGKMVRIWFLFDSKAEQSLLDKSFLSSKSLFEFDCKSEKMRTLSKVLYAGKMGSGEVIFGTSNSSNWQKVVPITLAKTRWEFACRGK